MHQKSSVTPNPVRTTGGLKGLLILINFVEGSKTWKSEEKFGNAKFRKAHY